MYKILLVEDEIRVQEIIVDYFQAKGYQVVTAKDGVEALERFDKERVDLVLLDIMMPKLDGFSVCRSLRKNSELPIIFLTAKSDEEDYLYGYELGADDYITKPFSLSILFAKVTSLIKRSKGMIIDEQLIAGAITINCKEHKVFVRNEEVSLAPREYEILVYLVQNKDRIITREQLITKLWGYDFDGNDRVIDSHIKKLRKALGDYGSSIHTVIKVGYRLEVRA